MKTKEEIFDKCAKEGMIYFNINFFKRTYPHLFKVILYAMKTCVQQQCQKRDKLIKAQDELIKELCEEEGAVLYIKKLEDKIEELKKEIQ